MVSMLIRESFLLKGMSYAEVEEIVQTIDKRIAESESLSTYNGTTFERTFVPTPRSTYRMPKQDDNTLMGWSDIILGTNKE